MTAKEVTVRLPLKIEGFPAGSLYFEFNPETKEIQNLRPEITILTENLLLAIQSYYGSEAVDGTESD